MKAPGQQNLGEDDGLSCHVIGRPRLYNNPRFDSINSTTLPYEKCCTGLYVAKKRYQDSASGEEEGVLWMWWKERRTTNSTAECLEPRPLLFRLERKRNPGITGTKRLENRNHQGPAGQNCILKNKEATTATLTKEKKQTEQVKQIERPREEGTRE